MKKFDGVMIITDLDGTLLDSKKQVGARSREAIDYFMAAGGRFTFATGRLLQSFRNVIDRLVWNAPVIFSNGAQIYDIQNGKMLFECPLDDEAAQVCQEALIRFPGTAAEVYRHLFCETVNENEITKKHLVDFFIERTIKESIPETTEPRVKILLTNETAELEKAAAFISGNCPGVSPCFSSPVFLEIFSSKTDKGAAALRLAKILGIDRNHLYAAGDQENDIDLLSAAALSFAPEYAEPKVMASAGKLLPDIDSDMMASLISHLDGIY